MFRQFPLQKVEQIAMFWTPIDMIDLDIADRLLRESTVIRPKS